jgi:hypothetical protein
MKCDEEHTGDWQEEVWRVKAELSAQAKRMGMREYLAFVETEAARILGARAKPALFLARDKTATKPPRRRSRKP